MQDSFISLDDIFDEVKKEEQTFLKGLSDSSDLMPPEQAAAKAAVFEEQAEDFVKQNKGAQRSAQLNHAEVNPLDHALYWYYVAKCNGGMVQDKLEALIKLVCTAEVNGNLTLYKNCKKGSLDLKFDLWSRPGKAGQNGKGSNYGKPSNNNREVRFSSRAYMSKIHQQCEEENKFYGSKTYADDDEDFDEFESHDGCCAMAAEYLTPLFMVVLNDLVKKKDGLYTFCTEICGLPYERDKLQQLSADSPLDQLLYLHLIKMLQLHSQPDGPERFRSLSFVMGHDYAAMTDRLPAEAAALCYEQTQVSRIIPGMPAQAAYMIALSHLYGVNVKYDRSLAENWMRYARLLGHPLAMAAYDIYFEPIPSDYKVCYVPERLLYIYSKAVVRFLSVMLKDPVNSCSMDFFYTRADGKTGFVGANLFNNMLQALRVREQLDRNLPQVQRAMKLFDTDELMDEFLDACKRYMSRDELCLSATLTTLIEEQGLDIFAETLDGLQADFLPQEFKDEAGSGFSFSSERLEQLIADHIEKYGDDEDFEMKIDPEVMQDILESGEFEPDESLYKEKTLLLFEEGCRSGIECAVESVLNGMDNEADFEFSTEDYLPAIVAAAKGGNGYAACALYRHSAQGGLLAEAFAGKGRERMEILKNAAKNGSAEACLMCLSEKAVLKTLSEEERCDFALHAFKCGAADAMAELACLLEKDEPQTAKTLAWLARFFGGYNKCRKIAENDAIKALPFMERIIKLDKKAEQGDSQAALILAYMTAQGVVLPMNSLMCSHYLLLAQQSGSRRCKEILYNEAANMLRVKLDLLTDSVSAAGLACSVLQRWEDRDSDDLYETDTFHDAVEEIVSLLLHGKSSIEQYWAGDQALNLSVSGFIELIVDGNEPCYKFGEEKIKCRHPFSWLSSLSTMQMVVPNYLIWQDHASALVSYRMLLTQLNRGPEYPHPLRDLIMGRMALSPLGSKPDLKLMHTYLQRALNGGQPGAAALYYNDYDPISPLALNPGKKPGRSRPVRRVKPSVPEITTIATGMA